MNVVSYTTARRELAKTIDKVQADCEPVVITRNGEAAVIMLSVKDYEALEETAYLSRSPKNAERLLRSIDQLNQGQGTERGLIE